MRSELPIVARWLFAATLAALGAWGIVAHDFAPIWTPVPGHAPLRASLVWATALVALAGGAGLAWRRGAGGTAGALTVWLLGWMVVFKGPGIVAAPLQASAWESAGETAVIAAAAWTLFATLGPGWPVVGGKTGLRLARGLYAAAMIAFGASHIGDIADTASLVPAWLPAHMAWAWGTGLAYIAAGVAILADRLARLAAALSAAQMGVFTALVWVPAVVHGHADAATWSETVLSWTLTVCGAVIAASYASGKRG
jgi:uncharacterized membrane protein